MGTPGHGRGKPRRHAEYIREEFAQDRIRPQDAEQLDCRRHAAERRIETGQRGIGITRSREGGEQRRDEFRQHFSGAGASNGRPPPEMPASDGFDRLGGLRKAESAERFDRLGIDRLARKDQSAGRGCEARRMFEQSRVMLIDDAHLVKEIGFEPRVVDVAGEKSELRQRIVFDRQPLGLLVGDHLQAMFDASQQAIGSRELRGRHLVDPPVGV